MVAGKRRIDYFEILIKLSRYACSAARELNELLRCWSADAAAGKLQRIHIIRQAAGREQSAMVKQLAEEFITRTEREDILRLSGEINGITEKTEEVVRKFCLYRIKKRYDDILPCAAGLLKETEAVSRIFAALADFKKKPCRVEECIEAFRVLYEEEKEYYAVATRSLFEKTSDAVLLLKWDNIFRQLAQCSESCKTAADIVEYTVMKNS